VHSSGRVAAVRASGLLESGPEAAFNRITRLATTVLGTPMIALTIVDDVRSWLKGAPEPAALCTPDGTFERPVEDVACQLVVNSAAEVCVPDTQVDLRLRDLPQIKEFGARAWLGTPITDADGYVLGNLCAMDTVVHHWTDVERECLRTLALIANSEIALRSALAAAEHHAAEAAELAEILEQSLIPGRPPNVPGVEIGTAFRAAGTGVDVLGDFFDVIPRGESFGLVLGDVSGHGATAARATAMARSAVRTAAHIVADPVQVLRTVNAVLREWFAGRTAFVTAVYATLQPVGSTVWRATLVSGGHPPGFVHRAGGTVEMLGGGGTVLGVLSDVPLGTQEVTLGPGDCLVLYTDGITEARPPDGVDQFDEPGIVGVLSALPPDTDAGSVAAAVLRGALDHAREILDDDAGVVVVRIAAGT
jgi:hypothetical protein